MFSKLLAVFINLVVTALLVSIAVLAGNIDINYEYFFLFILVFTFVLLPILDYLLDRSSRFLKKKIRPEAFIDTIDSIIQIDSIDELLNRQFNQILSIMSLKQGMMIFHDRDIDEYSIYLKSVDPDRFEKIGTLDFDNILLKVLDSPQDIIEKSRIGDSLSFERVLTDEMDRLGAEIIVPMFFSGMLTGAMLLGKRRRPYSAEEISALKIFASKIATLSINAMFWKELARKKELEKEKRLELRVQKSFLPELDLKTEYAAFSIYFNMTSILEDRFFHMFSHNNSIYFLSYKTERNDSSTLIFLPSFSVLVEMNVQNGMDLEDAVNHANGILLNKNMYEFSVGAFLSRISKSGEMVFFNSMPVKPYIFKDNNLYQLTHAVTLSVGDLCIYPNRYIEKMFELHSDAIRKLLLDKRELHVIEIKEQLVGYLSQKGLPTENAFLCVLRFEGGDKA